MRLKMFNCIFLFTGYIPACKQSTAAQPKKEPEKIEVFVDGKPIHVEPNTTVLQVIKNRIRIDIMWII
jgi:hypothetical protein